MALEAGTRLGSYEVMSALGAGGMGEVYRAKDTKLGREVAIKLLLEEVATDPERLARFEREARVLASLNHNNIATLYGFEQEGETNFLVMEVVEGETLAERIRRGAIPVDEALPLFLQIAEGLEAAHEKGVIHRDLKPANIKVTDDGKVKILDFGLAKAMAPQEPADDDPALSQSPTLTLAATRRGEILGTAAYMSPEQAKGKTADKRTDVWAFGACLYEALTGRRAFQGDDAAETLASVLKDEPSLDGLAAPVEAPRAIERVLRRCLEKDPNRRLHDIADARIEIEDALRGGGEDLPTALDSGPPTRSSWWQRAAPWAVSALLATLLFVTLGSRQESPTAPTRRYTLTRDVTRDFRFAPRLSPDGKRVVYRSGQKLWVRDLDSLEVREVPESTNGRAAFWSWDGQHLAWVTHERIWRMPAAGGTPTPVADVPERGVLTGAWTRSDNIYVAQWRGDIFEVSSRGGTPRPLGLIDPQQEVDFHTLEVLPDGETLLYAVHDNEDGEMGLIVGGVREPVDSGHGNIRDPTFGEEHILYTRGGQIWALPFSSKRWTVAGDPFVLAPEGSLPSTAGDVLTYVVGGQERDFQLGFVDRAGDLIRTIGEPQPRMTEPSISLDGKSVALAGGDDDLSIWIVDVDRETMTRLTFPDRLTDGRRTQPAAPIWSADGQTVYYLERDLSMTTAIKRKRADGTGEEELLTTILRSSGSAFDVSPDQKFLIFVNEVENNQIVFLELDRADGLKVFHSSAGAPRDPVFSPDGRFVAYRDDESGDNQIYIKPFPSGDGKWQASVLFGTDPIWGPDGDRLFFIGDAFTLMEVSFDADPVRLGTPTSLFSQPGLFRGYRALEGGQSFLVPTATDGETESGIMEPRLVIVENWTSDLPP